jgi:nitrite reductase/ring-hydroxylating ferredoxin subunit
VDEVPTGALRAFEVAGVAIPVLVTRIGAAIVATSSVCPHEDVSLEGGVLEGSVIECPGHAYCFDLLSGECQHDDELRLRRYRVSIVNDEVFVDLLAEPPA